MTWHRQHGFERIDGKEAMELIQGASVAPAAAASGMFSDGDILMTFHLPDGRTIRYVAVQESDYYGGHYAEIEWWISAGGATDSAPDSGSGGSEFESRPAHGVSADDQQIRGDDELPTFRDHASEGRNDSDRLRGDNTGAGPNESSSAITASASRLPVENRDSGITPTFRTQLSDHGAPNDNQQEG